MLKIIAFVVVILILWVIVTKPDTAAPFVAGTVKDVAVFLQAFFGALLTLLKNVISLFEAAQA